MVPLAVAKNPPSRKSISIGVGQFNAQEFLQHGQEINDAPNV
jgi:hypothetical protein